MPDSGFIQRLKTKWKVESIWQVVMILLTFALTGSTVLYLKKWLFIALGFDDTTSWITKTIVYLLFVFPAYQLLILVFGTLLGQGTFFWEKEKKLFYFVKEKVGSIIKRS